MPVKAKIDLKDRKILSEIDQNSRFFVSDIARKVGLSKDVVKYRLAVLQKKGLIKGYHAYINMSKLGLKHFKVSINLMDVTRKDTDDILNFLKSNHRVFDISELDVIWDIKFSVMVKTDREFEEFYDEFKLKFKKYIEISQIAISTDKKILPKRLLLAGRVKEKKEPEDLDYIRINNDQKEDFDDTDLKIIRLIANNARATLLELAKMLDLDSMTIKRRIDALVKSGIIAGFITSIDMRKLGVNTFHIRFTLSDVSIYKQLEAYVMHLPECISVKKAIGGYDFYFDVQVPSYFELEDLIVKIKDKFPVVREVVHFTAMRNYKPVLPEDFGRLLA